MMIRVLFIWAVRHQHIGYVQGINFLAAPLLLAYASEHVYEADKAEFMLREQFRVKTNVSAIHHTLPP